VRQRPPQIKPRGEYMGQTRSSNSRIESREQATGAATQPSTCRDCCFAGDHERRSRDKSKALGSDDVSFRTKKNRCGSEGTLGQVEGGTTEEDCLVEEIAQFRRGFWADQPIGASAIEPRQDHTIASSVSQIRAALASRQSRSSVGSTQQRTDWRPTQWLSR